MDFQNNNTLITAQPDYPIYEPRPNFNLSKKDTVFFLLAIIFSVFSAIFGIFGGFAIGYSISMALMNLLFICYVFKGGKNKISSIFYGILSLLNSAVFVCTTNSSVRFFSVIISFLISIVCFSSFANGRTKSNRQTLGVFFSAVTSVKNIPLAIKSLFSSEDGNKKTFGKVLIGLVCSIPVLMLVIPLLISSDYAFRGMMTNIFSNTISTIFKTIFGLHLSLFVITYGFSLKSGRTEELKESRFKGIENVYIISFLSTVSVVYLLYLFSQLAYFFSAFKGFLPNGEITYAQYARKGFFEMCAVAVINLFLVFLSLLLSKKENGNVCNGIKAILTFISVFTLIIIATAISKMVLYIGTYGMTVLRLTTSSFMLFLAIVFVSTVLRIYIIKVNIIKTALITACFIILTLGIANVNAVCARYNYEAYKAEKLETIDIKAIYDLGDEGIPYIIRLGASKNKDIALEARQYLAKAYVYDYFDNLELYEDFTTEDLKNNEKNKGFSRFSIPRHNAYKSMYKFIEKNPWFARVCYESLNEPNLYE